MKKRNVILLRINTNRILEEEKSKERDTSTSQDFNEEEKMNDVLIYCTSLLGQVPDNLRVNLIKKGR